MSRFSVVGGGEEGAGWAARFLLNGWDVAVHDVEVEPVLVQARRVLPMLYETALPAEGTLTVAVNAADALKGADCAFVADAGALDAAGDVPILTTFPSEDHRTTRILPIGPVYLHPLVRLDTRHTDPAIASRAEAILASVGMAHDEADQPVAEASPEDRDRVMVTLLRALKRENSGAGRVIAAHKATLSQEMAGTGPLVTVRRSIPSDWTDCNGHMNESRYGQIWSDAADRVMLDAGVDAAYIAQGPSYFTAETKTNFLNETLAGERVLCETEVTLVEGEKPRLFQEMKREADDELLAPRDQFLLHVSLETRRSCPPDPEVLARLEATRDGA